MKKLAVILTTLVLNSLAFSQFTEHQSQLNTLDLIYGQKIYPANFYSQFNQLQSFTTGNMVEYIGIGFTGSVRIGGKSSYAVEDTYLLTGHTSFSIMIPRSITIQDSINGKISGFNFGIPIIGLDLLSKIKNADILVYAGFNAGSLRMYKNESIRQKNPYISPQISICPRLAIGKIVLSLNLGCEYDVTGSKWRRTIFSSRGNKMDVNRFRQTGFTGTFTLGYRF